MLSSENVAGKGPARFHENVSTGRGKLLYSAKENFYFRAPTPPKVYSWNTPGRLPNSGELSDPYPPAPCPLPSLCPAPSRIYTNIPESSSHEPLRETSINNCVPSSIRFPKKYKLQDSELSKIHLRNPWLKNCPAPRPSSPPLPDPNGDSEEDYSEEEDSPRSSPLFHHRHRYNFSGSETSFKDYDPLSCSDYDEDEEDSSRSSPLFHHRHRYNSDSETPYYSPFSEDSDDAPPSALAHQNKTSQLSDPPDEFCAITNKEFVPALLCTSPLLQDLVPGFGEETPPTSSPPNSPRCNDPSGPLTLVKDESLSRFTGVKRVSLKGRHDVLVYSIPETDNAYVFCHERTNLDYQIFKCLKCWNEKVKTTIKVFGDEFLENPCDLEHICVPVDELEDRVERLTYKWLTDLQEQSKFCRNSPKEEYANFLIWLRDDSNEDEWTRKALLNTFKQSGGYKEHQELFARFCKPKKARIEDHIEKFVQQRLSMHACYFENEEEENSTMDESFPGKISPVELLEWIAGIGENEKFYTF